MKTYENLLLTSRQSCYSVSKFNDTLTGLSNKLPHNNGTVIRPSMEEHSTNLKTTINQSSYQNEEHSKKSNLPEHCTDVIKAIDVTQIIANKSKYALIDDADLDKHIMWTLNHDEKHYDVESDVLEKVSAKNQLVINDSRKKAASRKQNNVVLYNNYSQSASRMVNSDALDLQKNLLVNNDSENENKTNGTMILHQ